MADYGRDDDAIESSKLLRGNEERDDDSDEPDGEKIILYIMVNFTRVFLSPRP